MSVSPKNSRCNKWEVSCLLLNHASFPSALLSSDAGKALGESSLATGTTTQPLPNTSQVSLPLKTVAISF